MKTLGIYVHIPFCVKKCNYCDFVSHPIGNCIEKTEDYMKKLKGEILSSADLYGKNSADPRVVDTIFFGGGTPSLVNPKSLMELLNTIGKAFDVAEDAEISMESNPGTLSEEKLAYYCGLTRLEGYENKKYLAFNRISMGVQSLDDKVLKIMGRIHDAGEAERSFKMARRYFDNINVDIMLGVPGQTMDSAMDTVKRVLDWSPEHLSFYSLQLEEGTPFYNDYQSGKIDLPTWEENRQMYHSCRNLLKAAGYHHYEISNAAKPGFECRHNLKYWNMEEYLGFGESAYSFMDGVRFAEKLCAEPVDIAAASKEELRGDFIFTQLRLIEGLDTELYKKLFGEDFFSRYGKVAEAQIQKGMLQIKNGKLAFTEKGLDNTNPVMAEFINF